VAIVCQIMTLDRDSLDECVGRLARARLDAILRGIDMVLGRGYVR
jgi:mRNA-degrading endonuclease toxin of MazEF toxin-antitoxin module